jgi:deazaflavin-dependent oxidoreductase (nitroreductase family)
MGERMAAEEFSKALESNSEIELTVTGRASGREISAPVWFVQEDGQLSLVPVRGTDSDWYKNVLKTPVVRLAARGAQVTTRAMPITDPARVQEIMDRFRAKYGAEDVARYYPRQGVAVEVTLD